MGGLGEFGDRAERAARRAHQWHQGSGIHADGCARAAVYFEKVGQLRVAELFAVAAEAEAAYLEEREGDFGSFSKWKRSRSGKATARAERVAVKVEPGFGMTF